MSFWMTRGNVELEIKLMSSISRRNQDSRGSSDVTVSHTLPWATMFPTSGQAVSGPKVDEYDMDSVALMLHSSGMSHFKPHHIHRV